MTIENFEGFNLPAPLASCLVKMDYKTPTPIQAKAIPFALDGRDILGSAQTGTGKTAAFCIPMIAALINDPTLSAIVMTPTRELAMQVMDVAKQMIERGTGIRTALLIGGDPMFKQFKQLNDRPRLIIGTPGRMNDHLRRNPHLFDQTRFIVLDEADRMLDMGFSVQIDTILEAAAEERQTLMFSATFAPKIVKFAQQYLKNPQRVEIESAKMSADNIAHQFLPIAHEKKYDALRAELETRMGSIIVFVKTKHGADKMAKRLAGDGHGAAALHGGLNQRQRERTTRQFRAMEHRILVATDVAARGLDIPHVEHVINYDMPMVAEDYIHRIGRTARAGAKGNALAIVSPQDNNLWRDVERLLNPGKAREDRGPRSDEGGNRKPFRKGPYNKGGFKKNDGERKSFGGDRPFKKFDGERKSYNNDRPFQKNDGERKSFGGGDRPFKKRDDEQRSYGNDRPFQKNDGERKSYGNDRPFKKFDGEKKPFRGDRPFQKNDGERKQYGNDRPFKKFDGEKKPFRGDRTFQKNDGERKSFGGNDRPFKKRDDDFFGDRPVYADAPAEGNSFRKNKGDFKNRSGNNDRDHARSFNEDRPRQGGKPFRSQEGGEKRSFDNRGPKKSYGPKSDKPYGNKSDKPQGRRDDMPRYAKNGKPGFKKPRAA